MTRSVDGPLTWAFAVVLGTAATAVAVAAVHREFFAPAVMVATPTKPEHVAKWDEFVRAGRRMGKPGARVTILEFADFECPFCRRFDQTIAALRERYPDDLAYVFVHRPLPGHRFAQPAARVAECSARFGKFEPAMHALYRKQDSLGLISWANYAADAGVPDTNQFNSCIKSSDSSVTAAVRAGLAVAEKFGIHATPTVVVNGWRYRGVPSDSELTRVVVELLAGRQPFNSKPLAMK